MKLKNLVFLCALFLLTAPFLFAENSIRSITQDEFNHVVSPIQLDLFEQVTIPIHYMAMSLDNNVHHYNAVAVDKSILSVEILSSTILNYGAGCSLIIGCTGLSSGKTDVVITRDEQTLATWTIQVNDSLSE